MIIAVIPSSASVETLLNNLSEADFDLKDVSVILQDQKLRDKVAQDAGPFKGVTGATLGARLAQLGVSRQDAQSYSDALKKGQAFVAIAPPPASEQAAREMLQDYQPQLVKELH